MSKKVEENKIRIEYLPLEELQRWPRNPKDHDLGVLHQSVSRFGFVSPIIIDERTGKIIAGHGRLDTLEQKKSMGEEPPSRILQKKGQWLVPVIRGVAFNSDSEAEAYLVADNRSVEIGGWDFEELAKILTDLAEQGEEMLAGIGFDMDDIDRMLADLLNPKDKSTPKIFGWDYNRAYDAMDKAGISIGDQRICPVYGEEPIGGLWQFKVCFPEIWDKMSCRVPGAATAARYARTELYAFGKLPEKPDNLSWEDFLKLYIQRFSDSEQVRVATWLKRWIHEHYAKTPDPILPKAKHPFTGISWKFLLMIAMRGDFKQRKIPPIGREHNFLGMLKKYAEEYQEIEGKPWRGTKRVKEQIIERFEGKTKDELRARLYNQ